MPDPRDWSVEAKEAVTRLVELSVLPVIPSWSRLEPMAVTSGDLAPGAQALVADPLWMIGRQWQFDELRGEDAGTPVTATVRGESVPFDRFLPGQPATAQGGDPAADAFDLDLPGTPGALPLEVLVEAEVPPVLPLRVRTQAGLQLMRLLSGQGGSAPAVITALLQTFPVAPAAGSTPVPQADPVGAARTRLAAGRVPDGAALLAALESLDDGAGGLTDLPPTIGAAAGGMHAEILRIVTDWRRWAVSLLAPATGSCWDPHRLEHSFRVQAPLSGGAAVLQVDEYTGGTLDWFHGDLVPGPTLGASADPPVATVIADTSLPTPVRFAGMPNDRLFAFEDTAVYLGGLQAGRTDLARLAVVEFALAYSVDWFEIPLLLEYGSATRLDSLLVRDTFGVAVQVGPAREATTPGWAAFQSTPMSDRTRLADVFVLAPTVPRVLEGDPLEDVVLFRDEMANLVWGVERIVPDRVTGEPVPRAQQAARVSLRQTIPEDLGDAQIIYRLMTPVPENWLPFVAVRDRAAGTGGGHVLERRPMLRFRDDGTTDLVNPLGTVLLSHGGADPAVDRLQISDSEVRREGVAITRSFQSARTAGGGSVTWIGRQVRVGRGEGASGLRFDTALPPGSV